jgi:hypothetical protein
LIVVWGEKLRRVVRCGDKREGRKSGRKFERRKGRRSIERCRIFWLASTKEICEMIAGFKLRLWRKNRWTSVEKVSAKPVERERERE